jgi:hypothetical protein
MLKTIPVPLDGAALARRALPYAARLAGSTRRQRLPQPTEPDRRR